MKKQYAGTGILLLFLSLGLSGCVVQNVTLADQEKFIGTWYGYTIEKGREFYDKTIKFYSSGDVAWVDSLQYTFKVENDKLLINHKNFLSQQDVYGYSFKNDYNTLILTLLNPKSEDDKGYEIHLIKL